MSVCIWLYVTIQEAPPLALKFPETNVSRGVAWRGYFSPVQSFFSPDSRDTGVSRTECADGVTKEAWVVQKKGGAYVSTCARTPRTF